MRVQLRCALVVGLVVVAGVIGAQARGPLDPPPGPVQPTGPSLADLMGAIQGLGGTPISPVPGDTLFAGISLDAADQTVYFKFAGIQGEVTTPPYGGWSRALSAGQMLTRPPGSGPMFSSFRILAELDRSFPTIMQRVLAGPGVADVSIDYLRPFPSGPSRYLQVRLTTPVISAVTPIFQSRACVFEMAFTRIEWIYTPLGADGRPTGPDIMFCWNLQSGAACN